MVVGKRFEKARDDRAVILPAPPGSGKSTLCAALVNRGWRLLSDELTLVDFDAVRRSLRPQLDERPGAQVPPPAFLEDPIGAVRRQFEDASRPAPDADAYLTPAALAALTRGEGRYASERSRAEAVSPPEEAREPWPSPRYWGVNRARMAVADEGGTETIFTFERKGPFDVA